MSTIPRIMVIAGSIRDGAFSGKLASAAEIEFAKLDCQVERLSLADFAMPIYDGNLETKTGFPEGAMRLAAAFATYQGVFMVTPEYNQSLPPLLKNAIDWMSRIRGEAQAGLRGKVFAISSSSIGQYGGARALIDLRRVLVGAFGALVIADQMSVPNGAKAFAESGLLATETQQDQLRSICVALVKICTQLNRG